MSSPDWKGLCDKGASLSIEDALGIESALASTPDDLQLRLQLIGYYFSTEQPGKYSKRFEHIYWLIEHYPMMWFGPYTRIRRDVAPHAFARGKQLWIGAVGRNSADVATLRGATEFVFYDDNVLAETLIRRTIAIEPTSAYWHSLLARLLLRRATDPTTSGNPQELATEALLAFERWFNLTTSRREQYQSLIGQARAAFLALRHEDAVTMARRVLDEAPEFSATRLHAEGLHYGNIVLGLVAVTKGDIDIASAHLAKAADQILSPGGFTFQPDLSLASALSKVGEREPVIAYVEAWKRAAPQPAHDMEWRELIEFGKIPSFA